MISPILESLGVLSVLLFLVCLVVGIYSVVLVIQCMVVGLRCMHKYLREGELVDESRTESEAYGHCIVCNKRTQIGEIRKIDSGQYVCLRCLADIHAADTGSSDTAIVKAKDVGQ